MQNKYLAKKKAEKVQTSKEHLGAHLIRSNPSLQHLSEKDWLFFMMSWALLGRQRHFGGDMSVMGGTKHKSNGFGWDFGERVCGRKGEVLMAATRVRWPDALRSLGEALWGTSLRCRMVQGSKPLLQPVFQCISKLARNFPVSSSKAIDFMCFKDKDCLFYHTQTLEHRIRASKIAWEQLQVSFHKSKMPELVLCGKDILHTL